MPQNKNLSQDWQTALGEDWQNVHEGLLHTLGNLTLTGYNAEYSDRAFVEKRDMVGGFRESPLRVNEGLGALDTWDESTIRERADRLAEKAADVWASVSLPAAVLASYTPETQAKADGYTIDDHKHLAEAGAARTLFDAFRKQVLALNPCVTEEFLKLYVAYKAETNFVDVVPQAKRLRLTLNLRFHELQDPRGLARDVTNKGRWGNGDVEVNLNELKELPYALGLVRQALEKQMGNGGEAE